MITPSRNNSASLTRKTGAIVISACSSFWTPSVSHDAHCADRARLQVDVNTSGHPERHHQRLRPPSKEYAGGAGESIIDWKSVSSQCRFGFDLNQHFTPRHSECILSKPLSRKSWQTPPRASLTKNYHLSLYGRVGGVGNGRVYSSNIVPPPFEMPRNHCNNPSTSTAGGYPLPKTEENVA